MRVNNDLLASIDIDTGTLLHCLYLERPQTFYLYLPLFCKCFFQNIEHRNDKLLRFGPLHVIALCHDARQILQRTHSMPPFFMLYLTCAAGLKARTIFGGTNIRCPEAGLTITLSIRFFGSNVPKLAIVTLSPSSKMSDIAATTSLTNFCVCSLFRSVRFDSADMNSLLFNFIL